MKILVTGLTGQLGFDVMHEIELRGDHSIKAIGAKRSDFDLTDFDAIQKFFAENEPNVVIHCAAYTAVDKAEDEKDLAFAVNETGTRNIAEACKLIGATMIYVSTDYVFPGGGTNFYEVDDATDPQNVYGASKLAGEQAVLETLAKMNPRKIIYVSCNPATLARDLGILKELGFITKKIQPVDMFPMTSHVESISLILRK